jgi:RNA polymerase sigma factor (sigma-70 family)
MMTIRIRRAAGVLARIQTDVSPLGEHSDGELMGEFVESRSPAAFEELVCRHGPMVLGVCLRVLRQRQDAEDAFQATFLVLARKAGSVSPRNAVGNWLHGVALQTAVRARAMNMKRRRREAPVSSVPESEVREPRWDDVAEVLDEELGRLPDHYRAVILLCDVEGRTRADAARHLECPEGSVSSRLSRARALLARRLTRRGVTAPLSGLALMVGSNATPARVPAALVKSTVETAGSLAAGTALRSGISPTVIALTEGVMKAMFITKLKTLTLAAVVIGFLGLGGVVGFGKAAGQQPEKPVDERRIDAVKGPEERLEKEVEAAVEKVKQAKNALEAAAAELHAADERLAAAKRKGKPIEVKPVTGKLCQVDVENRTVRVEWAKVVTNPRAELWGGSTGLCAITYTTFPLAAQAAILQDNAPTKLADLIKGARITLRFGSDGKSVETLSVDGGSVKGRFESWNEMRNTVAVAVGEKDERRVFHLLRDTCVRGVAHVKDFKPGTPILVTKSVEDANTAIGIEAVPADEGKP